MSGTRPLITWKLEFIKNWINYQPTQPSNVCLAILFLDQHINGKLWSVAVIGRKSLLQNFYWICSSAAIYYLNLRNTLLNQLKPLMTWLAKLWTVTIVTVPKIILVFLITSFTKSSSRLIRQWFDESIYLNHMQLLGD